MIQKIYTDRKINRLEGSSLYKKMYKGNSIIFEYADNSQLSVSDTTIKFAKTGQTKSITINSNDTWYISSIPAWVTLSQTTGVGTTNITITAEATTETRENNITISTISKNIQITLKQLSVHYVSEIYYSITGTTCPIEIPVYSTTTLKYRFKGKLRGYSGTMIIGSNSNVESNDYRFFITNFSEYLDIGNQRLSIWGQVAIGTELDYNIGNNYIYDNKTSSYIATGSTFTGDLVRDTMKYFVNYLSLMEWQLWEGDTLVFDGKAAEEEGQGGIYDNITGNFYTNNDYQISYNE